MHTAIVYKVYTASRSAGVDPVICVNDRQCRRHLRVQIYFVALWVVFWKNIYSEMKLKENQIVFFFKNTILYIEDNMQLCVCLIIQYLCLTTHTAFPHNPTFRAFASSELLFYSTRNLLIGRES